jgi:hypothetical protein
MVSSGSSSVPRPVPCVRGMEAQVGAARRGKPAAWRRWIEIRILSRDVVYEFEADARSLTPDPSLPVRARAQILSPAFDLLCAQHTVRPGGVAHAVSTPAPAKIRSIAVDACRVVALRLHAFGVDRAAVAQAWPGERPSFASIVAGEPAWAEAPPAKTYPRRPGRPSKGRGDARPGPLP